MKAGQSSTPKKLDRSPRRQHLKAPVAEPKFQGQNNVRRAHSHGNREATISREPKRGSLMPETDPVNLDSNIAAEIFDKNLRAAQRQFPEDDTTSDRDAQI
jgi:hypothetical protein